MTEAKPPAPQTADQRHEQVETYQQAFDTAAQSVTKQVAAVQQLPFVGAFFGGRTSFEDVPLNSMLNLLESANPADLSEAGRRLQRVTEALNDAAKQLDGYVRATEWKGEGAEEFRRFGSELTTYTYSLGTFANAVGAQMEIAATGLTSVRNSVPPRDGRLVQKRPEDFPLTQRGTDNLDYQKAVKIEKDRQEAINQMNRLASFYSVSETMLAMQEPPTLPRPLGTAVPPPMDAVGRRRGQGGADNSSPTGGSLAHVSGSQPAAAWSERTRVADGTPRPELTERPIEAVGSGQRVEINSVAPPAPPAQVPTAPQLPHTGPTTVSTVPPLVAGSVPPVRPAAAPSKGVGTGGVRRPGGAPAANAFGRPGSTAGGVVQKSGGSAAGAAGRSVGPVNGRAGSPFATGSGAAAGRAGVPGGTAQAPINGRSGGATAQGAGGRSGNGAFGARGVQSGIVGGTPQQRPAAGTSPRMPRGTVIGSESSGGRAGTSRPVSGGVIGGQQTGGPSRPGGRGTASVNGVVGTPKGGGTPGAQPGSSAGGMRGNRRRKKDENDRNGSSRPDYLTEDEETWLARPRNTVPPVID
ncbi:hypothetical protein [Streptomyces lichenis]|uniref:PPE domain-containing protein n=1 Tax=Streptomyces lichenis TaxID=2306967 RepID=A0ABT0IGF0_9ACTN|nr:hypothetical protein [Streptomyces lichenis]MCK8680404.1 hypothetical protein [Streptomyces lichenis]